MKVAFLIVALMLTGFTPVEYQTFTATAYCLRGKTASGHRTAPGMIAADPRVLRLGTNVHIQAGKYTGHYTVRDTGSRVKGRKIDVWLVDKRSCLQFGRRSVKIRVVRA